MRGRMSRRRAGRHQSDGLIMLIASRERGCLGILLERVQKKALNSILKTMKIRSLRIV